MYKVTIIDDEPWSREVVKSLGDWQLFDMEVIAEAEDGSQGILQIEEQDPDIVITDMRMPGLDGTKLLQEINDRFPKLKIIVMSGYDDFAYLQQAIRSRAIEYLLKPINQEDLNTSLKKCLDELNQEKDRLDRLWQAPIVFSDSSILDTYLMYQRQISGFLHDLNKSAVTRVFDEMQDFLDEKLSKVEVGHLASRISHDFLLILAKFATEMGLPLDRDRAEINSNPKLFLHLDVRYAEIIDAVVTLRKDRNRLDLMKVKEYMDHHYTEQISLDSIARHFFVSKEHLSRVFKIRFHENISDYIIRKRMEQAKELIEQDMAIKHAAQMSGYSDLAYFYRVFKKFYGITPKDIHSRKDGH